MQVLIARSAKRLPIRIRGSATRAPASAPHVAVDKVDAAHRDASVGRALAQHATEHVSPGAVGEARRVDVAVAHMTHVRQTAIAVSLHDRGAGPVGVRKHVRVESDVLCGTLKWKRCRNRLARSVPRPVRAPRARPGGFGTGLPTITAARQTDSSSVYIWFQFDSYGAPLGVDEPYYHMNFVYTQYPPYSGFSEPGGPSMNPFNSPTLSRCLANGFVPYFIESVKIRVCVWPYQRCGPFSNTFYVDGFKPPLQ